jgi:ELWxxDGT repeat protein
VYQKTSAAPTALFNGIAASGHQELWVTDGTVAGTHELNNIPGEPSGGLNPYEITAFGNNEALFNGGGATLGDGRHGGRHAA